ncbi:MAG: hypothetical protein IT406_03990 [Candidatus Yanofskybacteria bacterium]|nr:hypothetical protein [Candidatus Yanofskybacteria bacterium]
MRDAILSFGERLIRGAEGVQAVSVPFRRIIVCGMGGSSVPGELLSMARNDVVVHWDYQLPHDTSPHDLVICVSWSGNTAETLSGYGAARTLGAPLAVITTGGELARRAAADGVQAVLLPADAPAPRCGAAAMTGALFALLDMSDQLPRVSSPDLESEGQRIAREIGPRTPVFYAGYPLRKIAGFFKTMVNENAKRHAWAANFPSAEHNELVGWQGDYRQHMAPVIIRGVADEAYQKDFSAFIALLGEMGYTVSTTTVSGDTPLEAAINGYALALWTSYHMAVSAEIDPLDTALIEKFKQLKTQ